MTSEEEELEKRIDEASMYLREWIKSEESDLRTRMIELLTSEIKEYESNNTQRTE